MGKFLTILAIPVLLVALTFGYFMSQNHWDTLLSYHVMKYEIYKITGLDKKSENTNNVTQEDTTNSDTTTEYNIDEEKMYKGTGKNGEASFSDIKTKHNKDYHIEKK